MFAMCDCESRVSMLRPFGNMVASVVSPAQFRQHGAGVEVRDFEVLAAARPSPKLRRPPKKSESAFGFTESASRVHSRQNIIHAHKRRYSSSVKAQG